MSDTHSRQNFFKKSFQKFGERMIHDQMAHTHAIVGRDPTFIFFRSEPQPRILIGFGGSTRGGKFSRGGIATGRKKRF